MKRAVRKRLREIAQIHGLNRRVSTSVAGAAYTYWLE